MNCCNNIIVCCCFKIKLENGYVNIFYVLEILVEILFNNGVGNEIIVCNGEWYKFLKYLFKYNCFDVYVF